MKNALKQLSSFILPVTVLIVVPLSIEEDIAIEHLSTFLTGVFVMVTGLYMMFITISAFIKKGKGTLAPWSPTRKLVVTGIYAYIRNPMILGVFIVLIGESIAIESLKIFRWAVIFFIINNIYFSLYEEPNLEKRFGDEYREYKKNVSRWVPRSKPYRSKQTTQT